MRSISFNFMYKNRLTVSRRNILSESMFIIFLSNEWNKSYVKKEKRRKNWLPVHDEGRGSTEQQGIQDHLRRERERERERDLRGAEEEIPPAVRGVLVEEIASELRWRERDEHISFSLKDSIFPSNARQKISLNWTILVQDVSLRRKNVLSQQMREKEHSHWDRCTNLEVLLWHSSRWMLNEEEEEEEEAKDEKMHVRWIELHLMMIIKLLTYLTSQVTFKCERVAPICKRQ